nr:MAG TPA: hypothetical protein [Caudoviricetes sp.]
MRMEFTMDNVAKWLKESTDWLIDNQQGCCTLKLDDHLAICVGWSNGFGDEPREDVIQAIDNLDYAVVTGVKVWTSDDMRTDFDFINFPYKENSYVFDDAYAIAEDEDFDWLANALITDYEILEKLEIDKDGLIKEVQNA